ncbi:DeoR/GlpR family DNA-binding transcription regulator [Pseudomonas sp. EpS/L25]|uniref:DeoR/GlpR family DNA-binding transcription regulator n=1 Tax=Pseudomonas sp. EpS/L25 TaxID=1749078 RepID=UPI00074381CF|nr:DeoR/GlpR family DNA-binding transcription regulator [Pseudomonas sp. EpS/L25]KUM41363.1 DeoR family transcriptional regulator [Pseudomonas sp. EpS/L25]
MNAALHLPEERQAAILALLREQGRVLSAELAATWGISEDSVRRDLRELARQGLCRRVYGGALSLLTPPEPLPARIGQDEAAKQTLGRAAAKLVQRGQLLLLDAGSTNLAIAQALPTDLDLTVATNAPVIAAALLQRQGIRVLMIGGLAAPESGACLGARAMRDVRGVRADLAFLGTCALAVETGVTGFDLEEAEFKAAVAEQSSAVVVAVTAEKLDSVAFYHVLELPRVNHLVVEPELEAMRLQPYRDAGLQVHQASR